MRAEVGGWGRERTVARAGAKMGRPSSSTAIMSVEVVGSGTAEARARAASIRISSSSSAGVVVSCGSGGEGGGGGGYHRFQGRPRRGPRECVAGRERWGRA